MYYVTVVSLHILSPYGEINHKKFDSSNVCLGEDPITREGTRTNTPVLYKLPVGHLSLDTLKKGD